jgi:hypothetical protein
MSHGLARKRGIGFAALAVLAFASTVAQAEIKIDYSYVNKQSDAFKRFKGWVDTALAGNPGYEFSAIDAVTMYRLSDDKDRAKYCDYAVAMMQKQADDAAAAISAGKNPEVAGDSYLQSGPMISALALTYDACRAQMTDAQRTQWSGYADRTIANIWSPNSAKWGERSATWTGWSIDNPGNNYYYSFVEATMYWGLASNNEIWLKLLRDNKLPALEQYFAKLPGGGSLEGTGYGTAQMRLFEIYRVWKDSTGVDLANANPHLNDTLIFWTHATVPTLDRFAPIGDQSRSSMPELFDYHRRLMLGGRALSNDAKARAVSSWWLNSISVKQMRHGFNFRYDLLPAGDERKPPAELIYVATGTGHVFARTGWDKDAAWVMFTAGPYVESHAHQDQGSFTFFSGDWLAVSENVWSHSGIQQGTDLQNVVRFVRDGKTIRQREPTTSKLQITSTGPAPGEVHASADLGPAFGSGSGVSAWKRTIDFVGHKLTVRDAFSRAAGTQAIFQVNVPVEPTIKGKEATAGRLRVKVLSPADAKLTAFDFSTLDKDEFRSGWRLDVEGSGDEFVVELTDDAH